MKLQSKVALITGSSRGIGRAIALRFAKEGAKIIINYKNSEAKAKKLVEEIKTLGSDALAIKCNVSRENEVTSMVEKTIKTFGKIDILVNNAGIVYDLPLFEKTVDQWEETLGTNLIGVFLCSKYASKHMKKLASATIINISSTNGINTLSPESADYDASKAGVISLTKNLAKELAPKIRVNCIAPGWVTTDINKNLPPAFVKEETKRILIKRFGTPEEIAAVALFLASDEASFMNGSIVTVDGGYEQ